MPRLDTHSQCQAAMPYYYDYLCERRKQIPDPITDHIAGCPDCQNEIQWLKEADSESEELSLQTLQSLSHASQIQLHCALMDAPVKCSTIKSFLPILAIPEMAVRISTPVTVHIKACSGCTQDLETLKQLDLSPEQLMGLSEIFSQKQTEGDKDNQKSDVTLSQNVMAITEIRGIMNRPDSGVVTHFQPKDAVSVSSKVLSFNANTTDDGTSDSSETRSANDRQTVKTRPVAATSKHSGWYIKPIAAAAAIIVAALFLFQNSSVKATDIGQIYEALKNVQNVMMTQYDVDLSDPVQQTWISRSLGIKLFKTNDTFTLYDIKNKVRKTKDNPASDVQQTDIDRGMVQAIADTMDVPWGLLPFNSTSNLPDGAVWEKVPPTPNDLNSEQSEIFDLFWSEKTAAGSDMNYRWRCHVDAATKQPFRVEWWQKNQSGQEYELINFTEITYPAQEQLLQTIQRQGL